MIKSQIVCTLSNCNSFKMSPCWSLNRFKMTDIWQKESQLKSVTSRPHSKALNGTHGHLCHTQKATSEWPFYFSVIKLILQKRNLDRGIIEQVYITKKIKIAQFLHYLGVLIIEFLGLLILNWNQQAGNGKCKCIIWSLKIVTFFQMSVHKMKNINLNFSISQNIFTHGKVSIWDCTNVKISKLATTLMEILKNVL